MAVNGVMSDYAQKAEDGLRKPGTYNKSTLDMTDFLKLFAAELQNQDPTSPMDNSEMLNQLAQMTSIQTMTDLQNTIVNMNDIAITNYSVSLVGKEVTIAKENEDGEIETIEGIVTGSGLYQGQTVVFVDGEAYTLSEIMAIGKIPEDFIEENQPEDGTEGSEGVEGGTDGSEEVEKPEDGTEDSGETEKPEDKTDTTV